MPTRLYSREEFTGLVLETVRGAAFHRATFGGTPRQATRWKRATLRRVTIQGRDCLQLERFDERQSFATNGTAADLDAELGELLSAMFSDVHLETTSETIDIRTSKKGKIFATHSPRTATIASTTHNRAKSVPLPEGGSHRLLEALGITGRDGSVRPAHRDKFAQINEFLKHFDHCRDELKLENLGRPVRILDCGCGASTLTLAMHYYLNARLGITAEVLGVDANDEVIAKSAARAATLDTNTARFVCQPIHTVTAEADVVLALHACDTATDAALAVAIRADAKLILAVPCCHKDLNQQIRAEGAAAALRPILRHGILHERQADLVTDAFRALLLRIHGYRTDVVEFISREHTARNLMIRAVKLPHNDTATFEREYEDFKQFWQVTPKLEILLNNA